MSEMLVPDRWKHIRIADIATVSYGKAKPVGAVGAIPAIGSGGQYGWTAEPLVNYPTVVVGRKGTAGKVWLVETPSWPSDTTFYLDWTTRAVDVYFVYQALDWRPPSGEHTRTTMPSLPRPDLQNHVIPLPPLAEQRAIAHALRTVQAAGEARRREIALERERKAALMHHLFTHGTRNEPTHDTALGPLPESWRVVPLGETGKIVTGTTPPTKKPANYGTEYMFITPAEVGGAKHVTTTERYLSGEGLRVSRALPKGAILITCIGIIGRVSMTTGEASATNQQINAIIPNSSLVPDFLYYAVAFRAPHLLAFAGRTVLPIVNKSNLAAFTVPVAPLDEQREIADMLGACDAKIAALEREAALHDELFRAMLEELMSGRLSALPLVGADVAGGAT